MRSHPAAPPRVHAAEPQQNRRSHDRQRPHHHPPDDPPARSLKLPKQNPRPQQTPQRIRIPKRKRNREPHIPDRKHGQRVRHGPQRPRQQRPHNQVALTPQIPPYIPRPLQQRRKRPPRRKHPRHHAERNRIGRQAKRHQLRRSLRRPQPHSRRQPGHDAQPVRPGNPAPALHCQRTPPTGHARPQPPAQPSPTQPTRVNSTQSAARCRAPAPRRAPGTGYRSKSFAPSLRSPFVPNCPLPCLRQSGDVVDLLQVSPPEIRPRKKGYVQDKGTLGAPGTSRSQPSSLDPRLIRMRTNPLRPASETSRNSGPGRKPDESPHAEPA